MTIDTNKNKYFIIFNTCTTLFSWGAGNSNKIEINNYIHLYEKTEIKIV